MHLVKASVEMKPDNTMNGCHIICVEMSDCKRCQKGTDEVGKWWDREERKVVHRYQQRYPQVTTDFSL